MPVAVVHLASDRGARVDAVPQRRPVRAVLALVALVHQQLLTTVGAGGVVTVLFTVLFVVLAGGNTAARAAGK
jgi:hypothetical protein